MDFNKTKQMVLTAVFAALTLLLGMTPIGIIPLGTINVTIMHIPVILGTLLLGLKSGLILGFIFGSCSFLSALGLSMTPPSALAAALCAESPWLLAVLCYVPRLLVPTVTYLCGCLLKNRYEITSAIGSLTNSVFYLGLMPLCYKLAGIDLNTITAKLGIERLSLWSILAVVFTGAGALEAAAAFIIVPVILIAIRKNGHHKTK